MGRTDVETTPGEGEDAVVDSARREAQTLYTVLQFTSLGRARPTYVVPFAPSTLLGVGATVEADGERQANRGEDIARRGEQIRGVVEYEHGCCWLLAAVVCSWMWCAVKNEWAPWRRG